MNIKYILNKYFCLRGIHTLKKAKRAKDTLFYKRQCINCRGIF